MKEYHWSFRNFDAFLNEKSNLEYNKMPLLTPSHDFHLGKRNRFDRTKLTTLPELTNRRTIAVVLSASHCTDYGIFGCFWIRQVSEDGWIT